jgi:hypothetical protein
MDGSSEQIAAERMSMHDVVITKNTSLQSINMDPLPRERMEIEGAEQGGLVDVRHRRRFIAAAVIIFLVLVGSIIGVSVAMSKSKTASAAESTPPTSSSWNNGGGQQATGFSAGDVLTNPQTSVTQFEDSLLDDDDGLGSDQPDFTVAVAARRVDMLTKLYAISGVAQVKNGSLPQNAAAKWIIDDDQMKLDASSPELEQRYVVSLLYYAFNGSRWHNNTGYLSATNVCLW